MLSVWYSCHFCCELNLGSYRCKRIFFLLFFLEQGILMGVWHLYKALRGTEFFDTAVWGKDDVPDDPRTIKIKTQFLPRHNTNAFSPISTDLILLALNLRYPGGWQASVRVQPLHPLGIRARVEEQCFVTLWPHGAGWIFSESSFLQNIVIFEREFRHVVIWIYRRFTATTEVTVEIYSACPNRGAINEQTRC